MEPQCPWKQQTPEPSLGVGVGVIILIIKAGDRQRALLSHHNLSGHMPSQVPSNISATRCSTNWVRRWPSAYDVVGGTFRRQANLEHLKTSENQWRDQRILSSIPTDRSQDMLQPT